MTTELHMSPYDLRAWESLTNRVNSRREPTAVAKRLSQVRARVTETSATAIEAGKKLPGAIETADAMKFALDKAMTGLHLMTVDFGLNSVNATTVINRFNKAGHSVESLDDIRTLDLKICDTVGSTKKQKYVAAGAIEGTASSLVVTGLTVSSTVSGGVGVGVAAGAIAVDSLTVLTGMGRIIASVAANYGYDVRLPEEAVFASGVLAYSTAGNASEKAVTMAALSRLTQQMMRRATWTQLSSNHLVRVVDIVFKALGQKLTHKKLAQVIPVVGVAINGGLNATMASDTVTRAHTVYRLRFLTEWQIGPVGTPSP
ncbi:EcsC family protein, partial [Dietzia psychralcaliphila]